MNIREGFLTVAVIIVTFAIAILIAILIFVPEVRAPYQAAWSTLLSAAIGFGGLIYVTNLGFEKSKQSARDQANRDRIALDEHWEREREADRRRRNYDARLLATALASELRVVERAVKMFLEMADESATNWENLIASSKGLENHISNYTVTYVAKCLVYHAHLDKLGSLPLELASDVVDVFTSIYRESESEDQIGFLVAKAIRLNKRKAKMDLPKVVQVCEALEAFVEISSDEPKLALEPPAT